ncbi:MAG: SCO family protein [Ardenticatenaceae bacterium]|nr:SCO family protein [Ardenticatenaceae bacterium]
MIVTNSTVEQSGNGRIWLLIAAPFLLLAIGSAAFAIFQPITVLPRITLSPGFNLVNQDGEQISNESLRGQITLFSFSYVGCGGSCTQSGDDIAAVRKQLEMVLGNGRSLQFVTISLDPEQDTPERLGSFTQQWLGENTRIPWQWLTGNSQQVRYTVGGGFDLYYTEAEDSSHIRFQPRYVLVDSLGMIRARYFEAEPAIDILLRDIDFLTNEAANSEGAQALAYEAAHLFACYPR